MTEIEEQLLGMLVCPVTYAPLVQAGEWLYSTDAETRRKYPIRDGIPVLLVEESCVADEQEYRQAIEGAKVN